MMLRIPCTTGPAVFINPNHVVLVEKLGATEKKPITTIHLVGGLEVTTPLTALQVSNLVDDYLRLQISGAI